MKPDVWLGQVLRDTRLTSTQRAVAASLWSYMDRDGRCWPGMDAIASRSGMVKRTAVRKAIDELVEQGHILRMIQPNGRLSTNHYQAVDNQSRGSSRGTTAVVPLESRRGSPRGTPQGGPPKGPRTIPEELRGRPRRAPVENVHPAVAMLASTTRIP